MVQLGFQRRNLSRGVAVDHAVPQQPLTQRRRHRRHVGRNVAGNLHGMVQNVRRGQRPVGDTERDGLQRDGQTYPDGVAVDCGDHRLAQFEGGRVDRGCGERIVVNRGVERRCAA